MVNLKFTTFLFILALNKSGKAEGIYWTTNETLLTFQNSVILNFDIVQDG